MERTCVAYPPRLHGVERAPLPGSGPRILAPARAEEKTRGAAADARLHSRGGGPGILPHLRGEGPFAAGRWGWFRRRSAGMRSVRLSAHPHLRGEEPEDDPAHGGGRGPASAASAAGGPWDRGRTGAMGRSRVRCNARHLHLRGVDCHPHLRGEASRWPIPTCVEAGCREARWLPPRCRTFARGPSPPRWEGAPASPPLAWKRSGRKGDRV